MGWTNLYFGQKASLLANWSHKEGSNMQGTMIGIAKSRIPVRVCFKSDKATSFTANIDFLDHDGGLPPKSTVFPYSSYACPVAIIHELIESLNLKLSSFWCVAMQWCINAVMLFSKLSCVVFEYFHPLQVIFNNIMNPFWDNLTNKSAKTLRPWYIVFASWL